MVKTRRRSPAHQLRSPAFPIRPVAATLSLLTVLAVGLFIASRPADPPPGASIRPPADGTTDQSGPQAGGVDAGLGGRDEPALATPSTPAQPVDPSGSGGSDAPGGGNGSGTSGCGAFPSFPDASCTGWEHTGIALRDCPQRITEAGAELDRCRFTGNVTVSAPNVTITRSRIEGRVRGDGGSTNLQGLVLVDVELDGSDDSNPHGESVIGNSNYTCIRCHIHDVDRGPNLGSNVRIESSYLHGIRSVAAINSNGGSNFTIVHNNLRCEGSGCSAALSLYGDLARVEDVLVQHNLFNTAGSYCTYAGSDRSKDNGVGLNIRYLDNRFGKQLRSDCGVHGPVSSWAEGNGNVWRGNEWADGSGVVTPR